MKTIQIFLLLFSLIGFSWAQLPGQPDCLGIVFTSNHKRTYGTLFEGGGGKWFFSCSHDGFFPQPGEELTFGNGDRGIVKGSYAIRKGLKILSDESTDPSSEYDLSIGELEQPVSAKPTKVWWKKPPNFDSLSGSICVTGFGFNPWDQNHVGGWFNGNLGYIDQTNPIEALKGLYYNTTSNTIVSGYSGCPVFYQEKLIGINFAQRGENPSIGGLATTIYSVFAEYLTNFPPLLQPPSEPNISFQVNGNLVLVVLKSPKDQNWKIQASPDLTPQSWRDADTIRPGFLIYDECPGAWETVLVWDKTNLANYFFRARRE